jgi:tRNA pseudouridine38-40 synthase
MHYYKAIIQYQGTHYAGFQWQKGIPTIQRDFNYALEKIIDGKITTMAASRTDSGVHAFEQVVKITSENTIEIETFIKLINDVLPKEIRCASIEECSGAFRPSVETVSKEYRYFFTNKINSSNKEHLFIANISRELDIKAITVCLNAMTGFHDFCNFYSCGSNVRTTVREMLVCELSEVNPHEVLNCSELFILPSELTSCFQFRFVANGFLKQMIRHLVSALWRVGTGKMTSDEFIYLLNSPKSKKQLWKVASSNGLFLYKVNY